MYSKGTILLSFSDAFGKAKSTNDVFSRKTLRKEQNNCSFCGESTFFMYSKGTIFLSFSDAFGKAKSTNDVQKGTK